jgi:hypothetical protein
MNKTEIKGGFSVAIFPASGFKCQRCWNFTDDVAVHPYWPTWTICARCVRVLLEMEFPPFLVNDDGTVFMFESERQYLNSSFARNSKNPWTRECLDSFRDDPFYKEQMEHIKECQNEESNELQKLRKRN